MGNKNMIRAQRNKNDEFYTQMSDIEKEVRHYRDQFKGKVVYCNCDDPAYFEDHEDVNNKGSNFWNYFYLNFEFLGLKKLIATHYDPEKPTYKLEYDGNEVVKTDLLENGDFRSNESIELLKESDIVCTNPPFSLFREYIAQLIEYEKDFLIMGNNNAVAYKEIFPLIKNNEIWLGYHANRTMEFKIPSYYEKWSRIDENGTKYGKVPAISWFTNLDVKKRHEDIILYKEYTEEEFPKYDNYDAIEVSRVSHIPKDYDGIMGVPITFLTQYNPEQFEILGMTTGRKEFSELAYPTKRYINGIQHNKDGTTANGSKINTGAMIRVSDPKGITYYTADNAEGPLKRLYHRVLIRKKQQKKEE